MKLRLFLFLLVTLLSLAAAQEAEVTITLDNVGSNAWVVTSVEGTDNAAELDSENTTITLSEGMRYRFVNQGGSTHPLDFRDEDGNVLLAQGDQEGSFEADEAVAFEEDDEGVTFTLTPELAEAIDTYYCSVHPGMVGEIDTEDTD